MKRPTEWSVFFFIFAPLNQYWMKKHIITCTILIMCLLTLSLDVKAQRFIGFVSAGANFAQIEGDDVHGFTKVGVNAGPGIKLFLDRKQVWSVTAELLYVQKGAYKHCSPGYFDTLNYHPVMFEDVDRTIDFNPKVKCNISLDYVQIPVIFRYEDVRTGCTFGLGFSWSRLVRAKEIYNGFTRTTRLGSGTYKTSDWSILADVDIRLYKNLSLDIRWEYSLAPIRYMRYQCGQMGADGNFIVKRDETNKMRNHLLSLRLSYYINETFVKNTKTNRKGELMGTKWIREIPDYD